MLEKMLPAKLWQSNYLHLAEDEEPTAEDDEVDVFGEDAEDAGDEIAQLASDALEAAHAKRSDLSASSRDTETKSEEHAPTITDPNGRRLFKSTLCARMSATSRHAMTDATKSRNDRLTRVKESQPMPTGRVRKPEAAAKERDVKGADKDDGTASKEPDMKGADKDEQEGMYSGTLKNAAWCAFAFEDGSAAHFELGCVINIKKGKKNLDSAEIDDEGVEVMCEWWEKLPAQERAFQQIGKPHPAYYPLSAILHIIAADGIRADKSADDEELMVISEEELRTVKSRLAAYNFKAWSSASASSSSSSASVRSKRAEARAAYEVVAPHTARRAMKGGRDIKGKMKLDL